MKWTPQANRLPKYLVDPKNSLPSEVLSKLSRQLGNYSKLVHNGRVTDASGPFESITLVEDGLKEVIDQISDVIILSCPKISDT